MITKQRNDVLVKTAPPTKEEMELHNNEEKKFALELADRLEALATADGDSNKFNWIVGNLRNEPKETVDRWIDDALDSYTKVNNRVKLYTN